MVATGKQWARGTRRGTIPQSAPIVKMLDAGFLRKYTGYARHGHDTTTAAGSAPVKMDVVGAIAVHTSPRPTFGADI